MEFVLFLLLAVGISLSGVMAPGPVTAAAVAMGSANRYAGALIALGHAIIEFPLMVLIILGLSRILESTEVTILLGFAGGAFLLFMAWKMLKNYESTSESLQYNPAGGTPVFTGFMLSVTNPYFLIWWATVGLGLATTAIGFGIWAFVVFTIVHWLCDLGWLQLLSWASFKGVKLLGPRVQRIVLLVCSLALLGFGLFFIAAGLVKLRKLIFF